MKIEQATFRFETVETLLAMTSGNPEIFKEHQLKKAPKEAAEEETAMYDAMGEMEKSSTIFMHDEESYLWMNNVMRGFFKENLLALIELGDISKPSKWMLKKAVDQCVAVAPRKIRMFRPGGEMIKASDGWLERPMSGDTMQGKRIFLARSEKLEPPVCWEFTVTTHSNPGTKGWAALDMEKLRRSISWGSCHGFGQWRSGNYGLFKYEEKDYKVLSKE